MQLTVDHSPMDFNERIRIQKAGGTVSNGRLLGILEVSRAIGDGQLKVHGLISVPSIKKISLTESDLFILCACDGLWKVFKTEEALNFVHDKLKEARDTKQEFNNDLFTKISNSLAEASVIRGCGDNVSVIIVAFQNNLINL
jgi:integrin-linked kinase-associated serine/threonine phosphatase 2C